METKTADCHPLSDFFKYSIDWISLINDSVSYDEMCIFLDRNEVTFEERYFMSKKYVVVDKGSYEKVINLLTSDSSIRITRLDIKVDFAIPFDDLYFQHICDLEPYSSVSKGSRVQTLYFNSRQSDMFCRLYDKQAESGLDFPLSRLEFEIKGDLAFEFSKRLSYLGIEDAVNFIYDKINEFCQRKHLDNMFYVTTKAYLPFDVIEKQTIKNKFRRFVQHYSKSYKKYMEYFSMSPNDFDDVMTETVDLETFLSMR